MFYRSLLPNFGSTDTVTYAGVAPTTAGTPAAAHRRVPPRCRPASRASISPTLTIRLGINTLVSPANVGVQGITNLGVGRTSTTQNIGGFVYSMQSDFLSVLVRALKTQGRIRILSRPQITCLDNQTALLNVGQQVPINAGGVATPSAPRPRPSSSSTSA